MVIQSGYPPFSGKIAQTTRQKTSIQLTINPSKFDYVFGDRFGTHIFSN